MDVRKEKLIPLYWDERARALLDKVPVLFTLPEKYGPLRCPNCDHVIRALLHYTTTNVYEMFCMQCGYERAHPGITGLYWSFVWEWENKQNKPADWAHKEKK